MCVPSPSWSLCRWRLQCAGLRLFAGGRVQDAFCGRGHQSSSTLVGRLEEGVWKLSVSHDKMATQGCPCGYHGDLVTACTCAPSTVSRYRKRLSGPLLDRVDIFVEVPRVEYDKLTDDRRGEPSSTVRGRVDEARRLQRERFSGTSLLTNADMGPVEVRDFCELEATGQNLLRTAMKQLNLSARGFHRILKLARTIADLAGAETIGAPHLAEALQYRPRGWEG